MIPLNVFGLFASLSSGALRGAKRLSSLAVIFSAGLGLLHSANLHAAESLKRNFELPADSAEKSLKRLADQSGVEVVLGTEVASKVKTNAVRGEFSPLEAATRMLEGTELSVEEDPATHALIAGRSRVALQPAANPKVKASEETIQMKTFVVTGSNIPVAAGASDVPIVVIGRKQIESTGIQTNPLDLLRKSVPSFAGGRSNQGNSNAANSNVATGGGSQISLRNLPTLLLVNGRRVTYNSINASGGKAFVDINMFPISAIDHIEVLSDGASAIYGSDAIGGVVNLILKSQYNGGEIGGRYAVTGNSGHYSEKSGYAVIGAKNDSTSVTVTASWSKTDPLFQNQRAFSENNPRANTALPGSVSGNILNYTLRSPSATNPTGNKATATSFADLIANGTYLASGSAAIVPFNNAPYTSILQAAELKSATLDFETKLNDRISLFGNAIYSETDASNTAGTSISSQVRTGIIVPAGSPFNPVTTAVSGVVVGTTQIPKQTFNSSRAYLFTFGARGKISEDWTWDIGYTHSYNKVIQRFTNTPFQPNIASAIAGGYDASGNAVSGGAFSKVIAGFNINGPLVVQPALDPFARSDANPASFANVYGTEVAKTDASLSSLDAKLVGTIFSLPAGKIGFAVGGAIRLETLSATPDDNSYNTSTDPTKHNWASGSFFFDKFSHSRGVKAYYAELRTPLTSATWNVPGFHALDLSLAGRSETYTDNGNSRVPKVGFRWQPVDEQFAVRFTYSKAFSAPTLFDEFGPPTYSLNPVAFSGINPGVSANTGNGPNPSVAPALAWSRSIGVVYSPKFIKGLTISANHINVIETGFQAGIDTINIFASVNSLGAASPYFSQVALNAAPGQPGASNASFAAPGSLYAALNSPAYTNNVYALDHKINSGGVQTKAIDFTIDYELPTAHAGRFNFSTTGSYLYSVLVSTKPGAPYTQYAGTSTNGFLNGGSNAKWSVYSTANWHYNEWDLLIGNLHRTRMIDISSGAVPAVWLATNPATYISSYTSWDLQVGYSIRKQMANRLWSRLKGVNVRVGLNNVFNRMPPLAPLSQPLARNNNNADVGAYSPIGRLLYVSVSTKF
ncbi:MAG: TonB-dependent receptor plug domain-containing protein [Lacunisphaera sp.]|nr:TonB-dependent receptor plug domain-containing protein [Lacunisphaera sp.]